MERTIDTTLATQGSEFLRVKFTDGSECFAKDDPDFYGEPVEGGRTAWTEVKTKEYGGRQQDFLTYFGPKPSKQEQAIAAVNAQKPMTRKLFDNRELSIMAQVALKASVEAGNARGPMSKGGFEKTDVTLERASDYFDWLIRSVGEKQ